MKILWKMLLTATLTSLSTNALIVYETKKNDDKKLIDNVSINLGLTNSEGKGLKLIKLMWDDKYTPSFIVDDSNITATKLLEGDATTGEAKAKDEESFYFLTSVLQLTIKSGTTAENALFDANEVSKITHKITNVKVATTKFKEQNDEERLIISNATFLLQFFKEDNKTNLGDKYKIQAKSGTETDGTFNIFSTSTENSARLRYPEFVYSGSPIENFRENVKKATTVEKWLAEKTEVPLISKSRTDNAICFNNFEKLIGWKARFNVKSYIHFGIDPVRLSSGDKLKFKITLMKGEETITLKSTVEITIPSS